MFSNFTVSEEATYNSNDPNAGYKAVAIMHGEIAKNVAVLATGEFLTARAAAFIPRAASGIGASLPSAVVRGWYRASVERIPAAARALKVDLEAQARFAFNARAGIREKAREMMSKSSRAWLDKAFPRGGTFEEFISSKFPANMSRDQIYNSIIIHREGAVHSSTHGRHHFGNGFSSDKLPDYKPSRYDHVLPSF